MKSDSLNKSLKERREKGGCGMWKSVGIPFMYKNHKDKLSDQEIAWYENKILNRNN